MGVLTAVPDVLTWAEVRAWLDAAEAKQKETGSARHISRAQLLALSQFASFSDEPEMPPDVDHVSRLIDFAQKRKLGVPTFAMDDAIEADVSAATQGKIAPAV
ncbi:hypothetical protein NLG97_g2261 [Lecanicillium saksenae]|uniref:Uncharacterized protein n=1 Tax=Lecanicillium saksenae TaxID=468837 RepID=A0ACC1R2N6_9HYPO|nr:hypothetical protein NLG97_g2261 [Lecanicillium saksenae]